MPIIANVPSRAPPPFCNAPKAETRKRADPIPKLVADNSTIWASSQAASLPVSHHRIKGALSN
jgi:hypothetical protein